MGLSILEQNKECEQRSDHRIDSYCKDSIPRLIVSSGQGNAFWNLADLLLLHKLKYEKRLIDHVSSLLVIGYLEVNDFGN